VAVPVSDRFLSLLADRKPTHVMARELGLSERTLERRLSLLRERFHVSEGGIVVIGKGEQVAA